MNFRPRIASGENQEELLRDLGRIVLEEFDEDYKPYAIQELDEFTYEMKFYSELLGRPDLRRQDRDLSDYVVLGDLSDEEEIDVSVTNDYTRRPSSKM
jgi:hypothetical protein